MSTSSLALLLSTLKKNVSASKPQRTGASKADFAISFLLKFNSNNLYFFVSQSGETADTAAALDICKKNNVKTCSVVNVVESTIARNADWVLPIHAGPEVGVASTKAFTGQLLVLYILCLKISKIREECFAPKLEGR